VIKIRRKQEVENPFEKTREYRGSQGYFKLKNNVTKLLNEQDHCSICGAKTDLTVHHVLPCENYERLYTNKDNLIVICKDCHYKYHKDYTKVNPTTLLDFHWRINNE
jgi:5-methylcytosine-specific restriction endonuclease McrA